MASLEGTYLKRQNWCGPKCLYGSQHWRAEAPIKEILGQRSSPSDVSFSTPANAVPGDRRVCGHLDLVADPALGQRLLSHHGHRMESAVAISYDLLSA